MCLVYSCGEKEMSVTSLWTATSITTDGYIFNYLVPAQGAGDFSLGPMQLHHHYNH